MAYRILSAVLSTGYPSHNRLTALPSFTSLDLVATGLEVVSSRGTFLGLLTLGSDCGCGLYGGEAVQRQLGAFRFDRDAAIGMLPSECSQTEPSHDPAESTECRQSWFHYRSAPPWPRTPILYCL